MAAHFLAPLVRTRSTPSRLVNVTQDIVLATTIEAATDSATRNRGLLGRDAFPAGSALILAPCNSIHMFRMRFAIDVLFVDRAGLVVKKVVKLRRNRIAMAWRAFATIEFCADHPGVSRTQVGDTVALEALS